MIETLILLTPVGLILFRFSEAGVRWVEFLPTDSNAVPTNLETASELANEIAREVNLYFSGGLRQFSLMIDWQVMKGFQARVLRLVADLKFGETTSYGDLAARLGQPGAARAVGLANSKNPCPLLIPCHRVVASDRSMQGYNAPNGIAVKEWLLRHEGHTIVNHRLVDAQMPLFNFEGDRE